MFQWTSNYLHDAPSGAAGTTITPSGVAFANSPWAVIHPGTDVVWVLAGISATGGASSSSDYEIDIGVGPTGSPTVVATFRGRGPTFLYGHGVMPLALPVEMTSGQPVLGRMRKAGTDTTAWNCAIQYYRKPLAGTLETTTRVQKTLPPAAASVALNTSASGYVYGSWTQIVSGAPVDMALTGIVMSCPVADQAFELEVAKGPSGFESVVTRFKGYNSVAASFPALFVLRSPVTGISAGDRVSARWRKSGTNTTQPGVALLYLQVPV